MTTTATDKVRLGIIGLGAQGSMYAKFINSGMVPNMEIGAICDPEPEKAPIVESEYPGVPFFTDYLELLDSGEVDAVVTCVPHYLHPEMGINALQRGVHALVEKPAGVYTQQVKELNAYAASKPDLTFAIMFNQRNNPLYTKIKEIVDSGDIGKIRRTNWIITTWWRPQGYYDQSAWRATWGGEGGGVLVNQAPHQLDLWQWICGIPQSVYAKVAYGFRRDIAVEDEVTAVVDYGDGATGHLRHRHPRPGWHRPVRDPGRQRQDRGREQQDRHRHPAAQARAGTQRRNGHDRRHAVVHRGTQHRRLLHHRGHRVRFTVGTAACRSAAELRREHPGRHTPDRAGFGRYQRGSPGQCHPSVQLDRHGRSRWTSTKTST